MKIELRIPKLLSVIGVTIVVGGIIAYLLDYLNLTPLGTLLLIVLNSAVISYLASEYLKANPYEVGVGLMIGTMIYNIALVWSVIGYLTAFLLGYIFIRGVIYFVVGYLLAKYLFSF